MFKKMSLLLALVLILGAAMVGCSSKEDVDQEPDGDQVAVDAYVIADEDFGEEFYGIGFRKGDIAFKNEINRALNELIEDGTAAQISMKWFDSNNVYVPDVIEEDEEVPEGDTSWEDIQAKGYFILGLDAEFPPMGFRADNGDIVGFDIDLAEAVAEKLGLELRVQPISWDAKELELGGGNIDLIWNGFTMNDERLEAFTFSQPYMSNRQIIVSLGTAGYTTIADLDGKKIGVQIDSSGQKAAEANEEALASFADFVKFETYPYAILDLNNGAIDAIVGDEVLLRYLLFNDDADLETNDLEEEE